MTVEDPNWTPQHPTMKRFNVNHNVLMSLPNDGLWFEPEDLTKILSQLEALGITQDHPVVVPPDGG